MNNERLSSQPSGLALIDSFDKHQIGIRRRLRPSQVIFEQGDTAKSLVVVERGILYSRRVNATTGFAMIDTVAHDGDLLGFDAFDNSPRPSSAIAASESDILEVDYADMQPLLYADPNLAVELYVAAVQLLNKQELRSLQPKNVKKSRRLDDIVSAAKEFVDEQGLLTVSRGVLGERIGIDPQNIRHTIRSSGYHIVKGFPVRKKNL